MESPAVTVLQLDTDFPRVPGDVGCPATYRGAVEILRVPKATVAQVVSARPDLIDITPFESPLEAAKGDVVTTSCGFLSYWQTHLALRSKKPFISSSLIALESLSQRYDPHEVLILTFDAASLTDLHFGVNLSFRNGVIGLPPDMHLRRVITENLRELDTERVATELTSFVSGHQRSHHKHLLLECTNLPPYKAELQRATGLPVTDILTCVEAVRGSTIQAEFLS